MDDVRRRLQSLETWRRKAEPELRAAAQFRGKYGPVVDAMAEDDRVAAAVATELRGRRRRRYSFGEIAIAGLGAACLIVTTAVTVIQAVH